MTEHHQTPAAYFARVRQIEAKQAENRDPAEYWAGVELMDLLEEVVHG